MGHARVVSYVMKGAVVRLLGDLPDMPICPRVCFVGLPTQGVLRA